jgi:hypothetical protein
MKLWLGALSVVFFLSACESTPPTFPPAPPSPPATTGTLFYLSDLIWERAQNSLGPFEKDASNGTLHGGDGQVLSVRGKSYAKGLGVAAPAELVYDLGGTCSELSAEVGIDNSSSPGSVSFQVYADEVKLWDSGVLTHTDPIKATGNLSIQQKNKLRLVVRSGEGTQILADWVNAGIKCDPAPTALASTTAWQEGVFGPLEPWPTIPTHAALLPDSTILAWYGQDTDGETRRDNFNDQSKHNFTLVDSWNIYQGSHRRLDNTTTDLFCAGYALAADGNLYIAGGNLGSSGGVYIGSTHTNIFNVINQSWTRGPDMTEGRWYPSVIPLPNEELLISGGSSNTVNKPNYIADVWNPATNSLRRLTATSTEGRRFEHFYPWLHVAPNGQVFYAGSATSIAYLDTTGTGEWSQRTQRGEDQNNRLYGSSVMYEPGKMLVMGGGKDTSTASAVTIDLSSGIQVSTATSMNYARTHLSATLLADGQIFVNGGNTSGLTFDDTTSIYQSEVWNPATGTWRLGATAQKPRNYHAVALLLPDGRVWTAGGGGCGTDCPENHQDAEMYYPPYLFRKDGSGLLADRPRLITQFDAMTYDQSYTLESPEATSLTKVALVALGSVTHAFNMTQRYVSLELQTRTDSSLVVASPDNANLAPPGFYLLFVLNQDGVPSLGKIVRLR